MASLAMNSVSARSLPQQFSRQTAGDRRLSVQNGTAACLSMKSKGTFNVEVAVGVDEPSDSALRRFRKSVMTSGVLPEVRRRRYFENTQDKHKRKVKELRMKRNKKFFRPQTWEETQSTVEPAPFADLFGEADDIFGEV